MKECSRCKEVKSRGQFQAKCSTKDGLTSHCKVCDKLYYEKNKYKLQQKTKKYYREHKDSVAKTVRAWYDKNRQKALNYSREWGIKNKSRRTEYARNRRRNDLDFKLICNIRTRLSNALRENRKSGSAINDLGCSITDLKMHLESQFAIGMTWDNYGDWHIDHKIPLSVFNLSDPVEFERAVHFSNLQPLWAEANLMKGNKAA